MSENLPEAINYQGYQIRPMPMKVIIKGIEQWNTHFEIWEHKGRDLTVFPIHGKSTYKSKEDAIKRCFLVAKYIINNEPEKLVKKQ